MKAMSRHTEFFSVLFDLRGSNCPFADIRKALKKLKKPSSVTRPVQKTHTMVSPHSVRIFKYRT